MASNFNDYNVADSIAEEFYKPTTSSSLVAWSECVLHLKKACKEGKLKHFPAVFKSNLEGPSVSWKVFRRLNEAITYTDNCVKDCMVFSFEERHPESTGQRLFLVTHPRHMWLNHRDRPQEERCTYEVIKEGSFCKLYFDLEFNKNCNSSKNGIQLTETFIKCIIAAIIEDYSIEIKPSNILWLDASTNQKYSCHLILQKDDIAFENNIHAGYFVSSLLQRIFQNINEDINNVHWPNSEELKTLLVRNADDRNVLFCDEGVYTKNRNFRLFLSTKYGKRAPLLVSENNLFIPGSSSKTNDLNELIFYDSLITYFRKGTEFSKVLTYNKEDNLARFYKHDRVSKRNICGFSSNVSSPYSEVDNFVTSLVKDEFTEGFIRKWTYLNDEDVLIYDIGNFRFCGNIRRHHRSNNIIFIVDMKRKVYYQKCHDPVCKGQNYKSEALPLPDEIAILYNIPENFFDSECFTQLKTEASSNTLQNSEETKEDSIKSMLVDDISPFGDAFFENSPFTQECTGFVFDSHKPILSRTAMNVDNDTVIRDNMLDNVEDKENLQFPLSAFEDDFSEDLLCGVVDSNYNSLKSNCSKSSVQCVEVNHDFHLENMCMEDLELEFDESFEKNGTVVRQDHKALQKVVSKSEAEEMSADDDLLMAEAVDILEASIEDPYLSEETIF